MRKNIIIGNWKMNKTPQESISFIEALQSKISTNASIETIIAPPFTSLYIASNLLKETSIKCAAQSISKHQNGAFTGDISAEMIKHTGCTHTLVGHSERRQYHQESNDDCREQSNIALKNDLIPIYCIGETLLDRENENTFSVIEAQLQEGLQNIPFNANSIIIAYEPVWAIGTGKVATPEQAQSVHAFIRQTLTCLSSKETAENISILYGGSVKPSNIQALISQADIDGALVGGACLTIESFVDIISKASVHCTA